MSISYSSKSLNVEPHAESRLILDEWCGDNIYFK